MDVVVNSQASMPFTWWRNTKNSVELFWGNHGKGSVGGIGGTLKLAAHKKALVKKVLWKAHNILQLTQAVFYPESVLFLIMMN